MEAFEIIKSKIMKLKLGTYDENKSFKQLTTLKIGGKIRLVFYPNTIENCRYLLEIIEALDVKYLVIGAGSNILASDQLYDGVVISFKELDIRYIIANQKLIVYPQTKMNYLCFQLAKLNYGGLAYLSGIPGTFGGGIVMNAGCYNKEISDNLIWVNVIENGKIVKYDKSSLNFTYRSSFIKERKLIVADSCFLLFKEHTNQLEVVNKYRVLRSKTQPLTSLNAGSTFKNPKNFKAWELINQCGLSGESVGGAQVSVKHNNFLINNNNAKALDMKNLIERIVSQVEEKFNIHLECEWVIVNF